MSFDYYRNRELVDIGGGCGTIVTNVYGRCDSEHGTDFNFYHCSYSKFKGTSLSWKDVNVILSDEHLDIKKLKKYTEEQCVELVLEHISAGELLRHISECIEEARIKAVSDFKRQVRRMFNG